MLSSVRGPESYIFSQNNRDKNAHADTSAVSFTDILAQTSAGAATNTSDVKSYLAQLQSKFGTKISAQNVEYSKANINHIGSSTSGTGNVIIASNILEKMASDSQASQHYEQKIQAHFNTIGKAGAFMAMHGRRVVSSGVIIHPDGKVTYYSSSDYTPEEKARLEKAMAEEDKAKAEKRAEEKRLNEIAQDKRMKLISYSMTQLDILSSDNPREYLFQIPSTIDISQF